MMVTSTDAGRRPAAASRATTSPQEARAGDVARRPVVAREQAAEVALPGGAEQRVGDGVEDDVAVGVAGERRCAVDRDAAEAER